jgi:hypothetical protein
MTQTSTSDVTLLLDVYAVLDNGWTPVYELPQAASVRARVSSLEEAERIAALFPKMIGLRAQTLRLQGGEMVGYLSMNVKLAVDGVNGGRNETGIKRLARLLAVAEKNGIAVEYAPTCSNSFPTMDEALAAIA